jgi:DNA-binding beta-propeller fold protein YncE
MQRFSVLRITALLFLLVSPQWVLAQAVPDYQVDASWPKLLPNNWIIGQVAGIDVDDDDNIWIVHRPHSLTAQEAGAIQNPPISLCCVPAPSVLQFDQEGNLLQAWGSRYWDLESSSWADNSPNGEWPTNEHGIKVDSEGNVWLAGNGDGDQVLKYSNDGSELLLVIGSVDRNVPYRVDSNDITKLARPAEIDLDEEAREVYVADGYGNRRVIVFDMDTGEYKRHWGAYGRVPNDDPLPAYDPDAAPAPQFIGPVHSVRLSEDGLVYVADRGGDRIQVFEKDGTFIREQAIAPWTRASGSAWDVEISPFRNQPFLFVADGNNNRVWIVDRDSLELVGEFGTGGRNAGYFDWVHNLAIDSDGNIYTSEVNEGKRVQKFSLQR